MKRNQLNIGQELLYKGHKKGTYKVKVTALDHRDIGVDVELLEPMDPLELGFIPIDPKTLPIGWVFGTVTSRLLIDNPKKMEENKQ